MPNHEIEVSKRALSIAEALKLVPIGRTALYAAIKERRLVARKLGRRSLILIEDLELFLAQLPELHSSRDPSDR